MDQIDEGPVEVSGLAIREALKRLEEGKVENGTETTSVEESD